MLGTIGDVLLLLAFVACGVSAVAFFWSAQRDDDSPVARTWKYAGRWAWAAMSAAVVGASGVLWYLILNHQYQYAYVYQNSSNDLPWHYLFSTFWAGQSGSFLFWILMMCGVGAALIAYVDRSYERHVMAVAGLSQFFLLSMIVGLQFGPLEIGASPFVPLAEKFTDAPIFQQNPGFIPADGQGLNDLLQNPWMTIHPPFLFVGFSSMVVPFAFAIAALWRRKYTEWVRPALPWTLFAVAIMGVAITMGGYWAWDPVENSSLVPWIVGVAAFHTMLVQKKSSAGQKASLLLCIASYVLVIYSTFLTRSGILGDVSVHSFVDLGLYNQLLLWIGTITVVGVGLFIYRFNELPTPDKEPRVLSREFMILSGATLLCVTAAVIILGTSAPIFGRIFRDNPSAVPIEFYNQWTLPLAIGFVFLAGLGQLFWWNKMDVESLNRVLLKPVAFATVSTIGVLLLTPFAEQTILLPASAPATQTASAGLVSSLSEFWAMYGQALQLLLLLFVGFFALFGNGMVFWRVMRGNPRMAGGAIAHVGLAITILGVIASSGFDRALPRLGTPPAANEDQMPRENFVVAKGQTRVVNGYRVTYTDKTQTERGRGQYIIDVTDPKGRAFTLKPVAYQGSGDQWFKHPDVKAFLEKDIFLAVTPKEATGMGSEDGPPGGEFQLSRGDSTMLGDREYAVAFDGFTVLKGPDQMMSSTPPAAATERVPDDAKMAVGANLRVTNMKTQETRSMMPIYVVGKDNSQQYIENRIADWGIRMAFTEMNASNGKASFAIEGVDVMPENWVVVQAYTKPLISLLWTGIIVMTIGFVIAIGRRIQDIRFRR
jgi:cytochrome c-type biogenesis protein CcmF